MREFIDNRIFGVLYFSEPGSSVLVMDSGLKESFSRFNAGKSYGTAVVPVEDVTGAITSPGVLEEILDSNRADTVIILVSTRIPLLLLKKLLRRNNLRYIASYAVIPGFDNPRWFFPTEMNILKKNWNIIKTGRFRSLLTFRMLQLSALAGYPQLIFPSRVIIAGRKGQVLPATGILKDFVSKKLGTKDIYCVLYTGVCSFYQKFTVSVLDKDRNIIAYARVGHTVQVRERIDNEVRALNYLSRLSFSTLKFPAVVSSERLEGTEDIIVMQTPSPEGYTRLSKRLTPLHVAALTELLRETAENVDGKVLLDDLQQSLGEIKGKIPEDDTEFVNLLEKTLETLARRLQNTEVTLGFSHGDFIPWNIYIGNSGLFVFDWEVAKHRVPLWDLYYFILYSEVLEFSRDYRMVLRLLSDSDRGYFSYIMQYQSCFENSMFFDRDVFLAVTLFEIIIFYTDHCFMAGADYRGSTANAGFINTAMSMLREVMLKLNVA
ncbi:MAG: phosphotransferase [Deferribacteres bacterium]|nr:phosphotransferase [Deferribacteres bacterium]